MNNMRNCGNPVQNSFDRRNNNYNNNNNGNGNDNCGGISALPENPVVAMAYVPFQENNEVYDVDKALCRGTVFPVLDKPFLAGVLK